MTKAEWMPLDAAAALVQNGHTLALGGMTLYRRPVGFVRALLRRETLPRDLTLLCFTAGFESDLLVGAGCVSAVRSVYFGLESFGFAPMFTAAAQAGTVRVIEETEMSLAVGIRARMAGVDSLPSHAWLGTVLPDLRPDVKTQIDPYTGEKVVAFPAVRCDVAVIHALEGDRFGNIRVNNNMGVDLELVYIADKVIVTVEREVDHVLPQPETTVIPAPGASVIALAPNGAWPTSCYPLYPLRGGEVLRYIDACNAGDFEGYLQGFMQD